MLDLITPVLAMAPYVLILGALAAIPADTTPRAWRRLKRRT